jgi:hypothetical protein
VWVRLVYSQPSVRLVMFVVWTHICGELGPKRNMGALVGPY